ncbi:TonB-dependent receptor [Halovulum dunhuangense]|uniref:TonB-dependent receptor n=1 Tax=Halovulum dunhuangense TaxID=1505036 RepID=A0A849L1Q8_9RHOB|nr:TonB-dependent receptor [Halovulum dunhuangense]NNU80200.1 TonB-dependent receptor [Halovulum dunhuangense]
MHVLKTGPLVLAGLCAGLAPHGQSQAQTLDIGEIVILPNRAPTDPETTGATVETLSEEEIEAEGKPRLTDYLTALPGVSVSSPGGTGQETSLSVRGADKKYVKTLFNGIDISDPSATQVQVPFEHLPAQGIASVEVLKGSQSTLYGADAVAGVIGISTLSDRGPGLYQGFRIEAGAQGTLGAGYTLDAASDTGRFSFGLSGLRTDGISAADGGAEKDGYDNLTLTLAGEQRVGEGVTVFGSALRIESDAEFDDGGNPPADNPFNQTQAVQTGARLGVTLETLDGRLSNTFAAQVFEVDRDLLTVSGFGPFEANYIGRRTKLEYQGRFDATDTVTLQFGADHETQTADVTDNFGGATSDEVSIFGIWAQGTWTPSADLSLTAGLRHDDHEVFGGQTTGRLTASWRPGGGATRLHGSVGTGYRAPSLYELYAPFGTGNPALEPEESLSIDLGLEQTFLGGALVADVTGFLLDTDNLIDYSFASFSYEQLPGTTKRRGVETSLTWSPGDRLEVRGAYTYTDTEQPDGARRPRIPRHALSLTAVAKPADRWEVAGSVRAVADVEDRVSTGSGTFADVPVDDYLLVDARVSYRPSERVELFVRGENLLDQDYQVIKGYGTPGIGIFAGLEARF